MGEDDYKGYAGFRRVKPSYQGCPTPEEVWHCCMHLDGENNAPRRIQTALKQLDTFADGWPLIDSLLMRRGDNHPDLVRLLLGLDLKTRRDRLRAAVARAYQATWRYSDHYCNWRDSHDDANEIAIACNNFIGEWDCRINSLADQLEDTVSAPWLRIAGKNLVSEMKGFTDLAEVWASKSGERYDIIKARNPRIYLYARLIEVYTCCSGVKPPTHASGKENKDGTTPEKEFLNFLISALNIVGYPTPDVGAHGALNQVAKYVTRFGQDIGYLVASPKSPETNRLNHVIDYHRFPTINLLLNLNCFSDTEL